MTHRSQTRRALVWGARGFIGHALVADLLDRGWRVRVLTRHTVQPTPAWADAVEWVTLDPQDRVAAFDTALDGMAVVFNLAGASGAVASNRDPIDSLDANCRVQLEFLSACARSRRVPHVVFASSRLIYANGGGQPVTEEHPVEPRSMYAAHKLCIEHYHQIFAQRDAVTFTVCRISNPFGLDARAGSKGYGFINELIQGGGAGDPMTIFGLGRQLRDYLYIADLVTALRLAGELPAARNEVFNVGLGTSMSIHNAALEIQRCFGGGAIDFLPWPADYAAVESGDFVIDIAKARAVLGFQPAFTFAGGLAAVRDRLGATSRPDRMETPVAVASCHFGHGGIAAQE